MLQTRLWMGAILVLLTIGVLAADRSLAPWAPFLFAVVTALSLVATHELRLLCLPEHRPPAWLALGGIMGLLVSNWVPHLVPANESGDANPWVWIAGTFGLVVLSTFLREMWVYHQPGQAVPRMALTIWMFGYMGQLPSFLIQLRWLPDIEPSPGISRGTLALALAIFVPKFCDVGAYFTGRFLGRHPMTPVLSPKKTWEGFAGGIALAMMTAGLIHTLGPVFSSTLSALAFGAVVGVVGVVGDLAESLIKRDLGKKDASQVVPGFGGVLDVIDSIVFAAPVVYLWLR